MHRNSHTYSQGDVFKTFDLKKFKFKENSGGGRKTKTIYKYGDKKELIAKIFLSLVKMIVDDMVEDGTTFHLPTRSIAMFTWDKLQDGNFEKAYQTGKFTDLDFIQTNFTIYTPIFRYYHRKYFKEKLFIVNDPRKKRIMEIENAGFKYC